MSIPFQQVSRIVLSARNWTRESFCRFSRRKLSNSAMSETPLSSALVNQNQGRTRQRSRAICDCFPRIIPASRRLNYSLSFTTAFANYSSTRKHELSSRRSDHFWAKNGILLLDADQKMLALGLSAEHSMLKAGRRQVRSHDRAGHRVAALIRRGCGLPEAVTSCHRGHRRGSDGAVVDHRSGRTFLSQL